MSSGRDVLFFNNKESLQFQKISSMGESDMQSMKQTYAKNAWMHVNSSIIIGSKQSLLDQALLIKFFECMNGESATEVLRKNSRIEKTLFNTEIGLNEAYQTLSVVSLLFYYYRFVCLQHFIRSFIYIYLLHISAANPISVPSKSVLFFFVSFSDSSTANSNYLSSFFLFLINC